jgi:hypothetical protein
LKFEVIGEDLELLLRQLENLTSLKFNRISEREVVITSEISGITICGNLIDMDTGEPVPFATVVSGNSYALTDSEGFFRIDNLEPTGFVRISHLGYKTLSQVAEHWEAPCQTIEMLSRVEQIREVTIRNFLTRGITKTFDGSFRIDYRNFGILPGLIEADVLQTVQSLPGVQSVSESVADVNIRGGSHHENLLLWDGIKMYQSGHFFGLISAFNPRMTSRVELIGNGTPARLTDGVSGTIVMETDDRIDPDFSAEVGMNLINADLLVNIPITERASVQVGSRRSITDLVETPTYRQYFDKAFQDTELVNSPENTVNTDDEFSFFDVNVRGLLQIDDYHRIRLNFLNFTNDLRFLENAELHGESTSRESKLSQDNLGAGIAYQGEWTDDLEIDFQAYFSRYNLMATNADILNEQRLFQENEVMEESVELGATYRLTNLFSWENGYQYKETGVENIQDVDNPLFVRRIKEVIRAHGLSSELTYQSRNRRTTLRGGVRLSYLEKFGKFIVEPRWSFNQELAPFLSFDVQGEMKHQYTTQVIDFQNDFLGIENRRWQVMNDSDIPLIESRQLSSGLHYNSGGWLVSIKAYLKMVEGITAQSQGFQNQFRFEQGAGDYEVYGADLLINKRFRGLSAWLSYGYMENTYGFDSLFEERFPSNFDITHALTTALNYTAGNLKISGGLNWRSGKPYTETAAIQPDDLTNTISYLNPNRARLDDYLRMDVSLQYQWRFRRGGDLRIGLAVWNVLDKKNVIDRYYRRLDAVVEQIDQASLGLTPNTSIRLTF